MSERKIGAGHAAAMARLGLKELRNAFNPSRESVADNEVGLYGTLTQGEIAQARGGPGHGAEQEGQSALNDVRGHARDLAQGHERNERGHERGGRDIE